KPRPLGVNLAGYFNSEKGVAEAARSVLRSLDAAGIPYVLNNVCDSESANRDQSLTARFTCENPYCVNLVQMNADACGHFFPGRDWYLRGRCNIGYWNWELTSFPAEWHGSFRLFDGIWAPSSLPQAAIASASPVPVRLVPFSICVPPAPPLGMRRGYFGLPPEAFLFFFAFDCHSFLERKNPLAVLRAFREAFGS